MIPLDPLTLGIAFALWLAFNEQKDKFYGVMTPERQEMYQNLLEHCKDPDRLRTMANEFDKAGLKIEARVIRKRAEWRSMPEVVKAQYDAIYAKALQSENIAAILEVARGFEEKTATVRAKKLRDRAQFLAEQAQRVGKPAEQAPTPAPATVKEEVKARVQDPSTNGAADTDIPGNTEETEVPKKQAQAKA